MKMTKPSGIGEEGRTKTGAVTKDQQSLKELAQKSNTAVLDQLLSLLCIVSSGVLDNDGECQLNKPGCVSRRMCLSSEFFAVCRQFQVREQHGNVPV